MVSSELLLWHCPYFLITAKSFTNLALPKIYTLHMQFYAFSLIQAHSSFNTHIPLSEVAFTWLLESTLLFPTLSVPKTRLFLVPVESRDVPSKSRAMKAKPFCRMQDFPAKVQRTGLAQLLMKAKAEVTARLDL